MKTLYIFLIALLSLAGGTRAQVAAPSLTPLNGVSLNPAAIQWSRASFAGVAVAAATAVEKDGQGDKSGDVKLRFQKAQFRWIGESFSLAADAGTVDGEFESADGTAKFDVKSGFTRYNLALQSGDILALGAGYLRAQEDSHGEATISGFDFVADEENVTAGTFGGVSLRLAGIIFLGAVAGRENRETIKEVTVDGVLFSQDEFSSDREIRAFGAGILWIGDGGGAIHLELIRETRDPFMEPDAPNSDAKADELESDTAVVELIWGNVLVSYIRTTSTETDSDSSGTKKEELVSTALQIGWVPLEGLSVTYARFTDDGETFLDGVLTQTSSQDAQAVTLSWMY